MTQPVLADSPSEEVRVLVEQWNLLLDNLDTAANFADFVTAAQTAGDYEASKIELRPVGIPAAMSSRFPRR